ncbi:signal transducer and activator of transcription 5B-like [Dysidea avara]|uniref:signal transducer and activator of transcription 5B-like n=1 Tax=Dysidea avara TaxID=196820 RepID=UPI0033176786
MALWVRSQQLTGPLLKELQSLYGEHFPLELRDCLASWIESQPWGDIVPSDKNHQLYASTFFTDMLSHLQKLSSNPRQPFIIRIKAERHAAAMKQRYQTQPLEFVRVIQTCLLREKELVDQQENSIVQDTPNPILVINRGLEWITCYTEKLEADFQMLHSRQERFILQYQEFIKLEAMLKQAAAGDQFAVDQLKELNKQRSRKAELDESLKREVEEILRLRQELGQNYLKCLQEITNIQGVVLDQELANWKRMHQLCGQEESPNKKEVIDQLQQWCEQLADLLWRNRMQIVQFDKMKKDVPISDPQDPAIYQHLQASVGSLLNKLIQESFIIEKQPPQVLKIKKGFSAEIRLLVGTKLNIYMNTPEVEVSIVNDKQAKLVLFNSTSIVKDNVGEILNRKKNMEYLAADQTVVCKFNSMQIKNKVRRSAASDQNVTEEKFALVFQSVLHVGREVELVVKAISIPVVVVVHGIQQSSAEATIFWDNYFAESKRQLFNVPDQVPWTVFSQALSNYFEQQTGRGLNEQNLEYLARKLQNAAVPNSEMDLSNFAITYSMIVKDHIHPSKKGERSATFWEWFYATCDLVRTCIGDEWRANLVYGFVDRQEAHDMLLKCYPGTFLIRFSQHQPGLSVAFVKTEDDTSTNIRDLMPWVKSKLLTERKMSDRLNDLLELKFLYPNREKNEAFQDFYSLEDDDHASKDGPYYKSELRERIHHKSNGYPESLISSQQPSPRVWPPYSPTSSINSVPFGSPFQAPSPGSVLSPLNDSLQQLDLDIGSMLGDIDIQLPPDVAELSQLMSSFTEQLQQGTVSYNREQLTSLLAATHNLTENLKQKLAVTFT